MLFFNPLWSIGIVFFHHLISQCLQNIRNSKLRLSIRQNIYKLRQNIKGIILFYALHPYIRLKLNLRGSNRIMGSTNNTHYILFPIKYCLNWPPYPPNPFHHGNIIRILQSIHNPIHHISLFLSHQLRILKLFQQPKSPGH